MLSRVTKRRLEELRHELTERDNAILEALRDCRYLTGQQIVRLYFGGNAESQTAQFSAAYRCLNRLRDYGLIKSLQRRIGGVRAGSGSYVWRLTQAGFRLLHMYSADRQIHKPYREPSLTFLSHTLLISEAWVQLTEICAKHDFVIAGVQFEPDSWRYYFARLGKTDTLKPDLYAAIRSDGYEDHWFIEIDRDTETVARILEKCERYIHYQRTGAEQQQSGVFPYVVWIVPDARRKNSLISHISKER